MGTRGPVLSLGDIQDTNAQHPASKNSFAAMHSITTQSCPCALPIDVEAGGAGCQHSPLIAALAPQAPL
jgi:hypothetical protein